MGFYYKTCIVVSADQLRSLFYEKGFSADQLRSLFYEKGYLTDLLETLTSNQEL